MHANYSNIPAPPIFMCPVSFYASSSPATMSDEMQALLARNQLGLSIAVDISQALKSYAPVSDVFTTSFF